MRTPAILVLTVVLVAAAAACGDDEPRRVLLIGDSVMSQTAPALSQAVGEDVDVRNESVSGSGLLSPGFVDWPDQTRRLVERYDPDVVVFLFVGNYDLGTGSVFTSASGDRIEDRLDPAFARSWQAQATRMAERVEEADAQAIWVLPPPMQDQEDQTVVDDLTTVYEAVVDDVGGITLDATEVLGDEDGGFLRRNDAGEALRSPDGVHLGPEGARRLADLIAEGLPGG